KDLLAMWVADMDFEIAEPIRKAVGNYAANIPWGYYNPGPGYKQAFIDWEEKYHGYKLDPDWICFSPGIVAAFFWVTRMKTQPGDAVILLAPIYYPMMNAVKFNDRKLVLCDMVHDGNTYRVDYEKFEKDIVDNNAKVFILSSPHNPVGKIWTPEELKKLMEICRKHNVFVISDEIHQDFEWNGHVHVPTATLGDYDDMLITMCAVSKTFNLAACQNSFIIIPNAELRESFKKFAASISCSGGNGFGYVAVEAACREGRPWFEEVKKQIWENYCYVRDTFAKELPDVVVADLQGTYLLWLDFGKYFKTQKEIEEFMQGKCKLAFDYGNWFGAGGDDYCQFVRMNLATSLENVKEACDRMIKNLK
ncbi:MAG: aminotransferase class I/II-fold pyridoxal phosphate-dependent enzyme, partial [Firmicutes bacterium]|nr:aminotransferase class I/II-fold pyridoxal phosphate-dependent enzyme [Bacillota bacterium]